jgi:hypothetical protein
MIACISARLLVCDATPRLSDTLSSCSSPQKTPMPALTWNRLKI